MARSTLNRVKSLIRRQALIGGLAAGLVVTMCFDFGARRYCSPSSSFFSFAPSASEAAQLRISDWDAPLSGFAARTWAWTDVDLSKTDVGASSMLWQTKAGGAVATTPHAQVARLYRVPSLIDVAPLDERFGVHVRMRATQFGFPFRSSVRETTWGVLRRPTPTSAETCNAKPGTLAVCIEKGWAWSPNASAADQHRTANGGSSQRQWLLPIGALANTAAFSAFFFIVFSVPLVVRDRVRLRNGRCVSCGYALAGIAGHRCPECGADVRRRK